jgi:poly(3-hydroxyalkanoate) synthetase
LCPHHVRKIAPVRWRSAQRPGKFDGTWLILNFDDLNPANWLWGKQYEIYANIDVHAERFLEFEKWWGDFIQLNRDEIQFIVDNFFIGDKLTRNQLQSSDGTTFDLRNITSPIIVFASQGDNISPPQQTLGWILDLYRDIDDIRAIGRTIVYCLNQTVGHLAIFVSSKVYRPAASTRAAE